MTSIAKRVLLGRPLATHEQGDQLLPKVLALPTFSADAISSSAYATEQILVVLTAGGSSLALGLAKLVPISVVVAVLLVIVVSSYRQTLFAYPSGGGSYIVSRENLGRLPSLVAAASLMIDYVLTVAVSISAGVAAIVSLPALNGLSSSTVLLCLAAVAIITVGNLRGMRQSGAVFAVPTYAYVAIMVVLLVTGLGRAAFGHLATIPFNAKDYTGTLQSGGTLGLFLLLKGFSSGAVALSGVEAISNGVPAFRPDAPKNAAITMAWMATMLGGLFLGVSILAEHLKPYPSRTQTVVSELGRAVLGQGPLYIILQVATAAILTLAANTAYADFPRLASIVAKDGFAPRELARRGDRLVFSNGILTLAAAAAVLVIAFRGRTSALVPLYAVGVFTAFTLSQAGMVRHHRRVREPGWRWRQVVNAVGSAATGVVALIIAVSKFTSGAWIPVVVVPLIVGGFLLVRRYYDRLETALAVSPELVGAEPSPLIAVVMVSRLHKGVLKALGEARAMKPEHLVALHISVDDDDAESLLHRWTELGIDVPLETAEAHFRDIAATIEEHLRSLAERWPGCRIAVVASQYAGGRLFDDLLHNQGLLMLREKLMVDCDVTVVSVPYRLR
ncbi:MAG: APC family permease [Acidimicrobiales bacterium]